METAYTRAVWWLRRRVDLGLPRSRAAIAKRLGLSERTVLRYESGAPPVWYELALIGSAIQSYDLSDVHVLDVVRLQPAGADRARTASRKTPRSPSKTPPWKLRP